MFTFRTLTTIGLVLVLAAGASAANKKARSGGNHAKAKVHQPNQSRQFASKSAPRAAGNFDPFDPDNDYDEDHLKKFPHRFPSSNSRGKSYGGKLNVVEEDDIDTEEVPKNRARSTKSGGKSYGGTPNVAPKGVNPYEDEEEWEDPRIRATSTKSGGKSYGGTLNEAPRLAEPEEDDIDTEEVAKIRARSSNSGGKPGKFGPQKGLTPPLGTGKGDFKTAGGTTNGTQLRSGPPAAMTSLNTADKTASDILKARMPK